MGNTEIGAKGTGKNGFNGHLSYVRSLCARNKKTVRYLLRGKAAVQIYLIIIL